MISGLFDLKSSGSKSEEWSMTSSESRFTLFGIMLT